jgi:release factor glutamine methyltransferase
LNQHLRDNKAGSIWHYLLRQLHHLYNEREAATIAALLFKAYTGWNKAELLIRMQEPLSESNILEFHFALKRLMKHEPLQYVLGKTWFYGLELEVTPAVLIPRPETEELVKIIVDRHANHPGLRILDIGTGSGCIAIALAHMLPGAVVSALDVSVEALAVAEANAARTQVSVCFQKVDILEEMPEGFYDIVVSNPPYVLRSDMAHMEPRVLDYEPHLALFVEDNDPLLYYRRMLSLFPRLCPEGGKMYVEIHEDLGEHFHELGAFELLSDMQGKDRFALYQS